jgi:type II secretory pathway pseudopilin PulG
MKILSEKSKKNNKNGLVLHHFKNGEGFAMVEALVSIALIAILLITFEVLIAHAIKINRINRYELKASLYLREVIEIAKDLEQSDWDTLISSTCLVPNACHPLAIGGAWALVGGQEVLDSNTYTRTISIEPVCRDDSGFPNNIVPCPGLFDDPDTKKVIATIEWDDGFTNRDLTLETYVYHYEEE